MNQNRNISQNPIFWPILALKWANESPKNFEQTKKSQLTFKYHCNQSKYAISEESNEPNELSAENPFLGTLWGLNGPILGPNIFFKHNKHQ